MAKKSLKKRIDDLVDALGGAEKPTFLDIRNELFSIGTLVEALEDGQALAEKEAQITVLEAALEKSNLENAELHAELQTANTEVEAFRAEREKQEEEERQKDIPDIQFRILRRIPSEAEGNLPRIDEVSRALGIPVDETEIHVNRLEKLKLVARQYPRRYRSSDEMVWHRTIKGSELVLAKRLAGKEGETKPQRKHAERTAIEEKVMGYLAFWGDMSCDDFDPSTEISTDRAEVALKDLY